MSDVTEQLSDYIHNLPKKGLLAMAREITNDLNKRCASLCLEPDDGMDVFYWSDITGRFTHYEDMHFHDSYDWAMLLVAKCDELGVSRYDITLKMLKGYSESWPDLMFQTPQQISEACLSVLEAS